MGEWPTDDSRSIGKDAVAVRGAARYTSVRWIHRQGLSTGSVRRRICAVYVTVAAFVTVLRLLRDQNSCSWPNELDAVGQLNSKEVSKGIRRPTVTAHHSGKYG